MIDENDPHLNDFRILETKGLCLITVLDGVGAEKFAEHAWRFADLVREQTDGRCWCESAECSEHGANSAIHTPLHGRKQGLMTDPILCLGTPNTYGNCKHGDKLSLRRTPETYPIPIKTRYTLC